MARLDWRLGVAAGFVTLLAVILSSRPRRLGVLNTAMLAFFAAAGVLAVVSPDSGIQDALHPIAAAWLCLVALVSIAIGRPVTMDIARDEVPASVASPEFLALNRTITERWAGTFAAMAAAGLVADAFGRPVLGTVATVASLIGTAKWSPTVADRSVPMVAASH